MRDRNFRERERERERGGGERRRDSHIVGLYRIKGGCEVRTEESMKS